MNRHLDPTAALHWLAGRLERPHWSLAQAVVVGALRERDVRARRFGAGLTVALSLDWPVAQAAQACLLLASSPQSCDDALYLAEKRLWLLRRYPTSLTEVELDLLFKQQQSVAALLVPSEGAAPAPAPLIGRYV
ncbi:protein EsaB [Pandoraea sputorum]|uniref:protein EsaB n=1 Tax=Pandoraea sputorum TaxID=93222 RepID=UPI0012420521|nr:protein EsaB [Pandoraea sputorum]